MISHNQVDMSDWVNILGLLGLGAVITELARGVMSWFMHKRQWSDEIKKTVIMKKLQVSEDAMACLQSCEGELMQLKMICDVENDIPTSYLEWGRNLEEHMKALYLEIQSKLNRLCTYYDFSELEKKYDIYRKMEELNKDVAELSTYCQHIQEAEMTNGIGKVRIMKGGVHELKDPLMDRLRTSIPVFIQYAEEMQKIVRNEINGYCK